MRTETMTPNELIVHIEDKTLWTKSRTDEDLWTYLTINKNVKLGRQRFDWAIFVRGKNVGFFYAENYKTIPEKLIARLINLL